MFNQAFQDIITTLLQMIAALKQRFQDPTETAAIDAASSAINTFFQESKNKVNHSEEGLARLVQDLANAGEKADRLLPPNSAVRYAIQGILYQHFFQQVHVPYDFIDKEQLDTIFRAKIWVFKDIINRAFETTRERLKMYLDLYRGYLDLEKVLPAEHDCITELVLCENRLKFKIREGQAAELKNMWFDIRDYLSRLFDPLPMMRCNELNPDGVLLPYKGSKTAILLRLLTIENELIKNTAELLEAQQVYPIELPFHMLADKTGICFENFKEAYFAIDRLLTDQHAKWMDYVLHGTGSSARLNPNRKKVEVISRYCSRLAEIYQSFHHGELFCTPSLVVTQLLEATVKTLFAIFDISVAEKISPGNSCRDFIAEVKALQQFQAKYCYLFNAELCRAISEAEQQRIEQFFEKKEFPVKAPVPEIKLQ